MAEGEPQPADDTQAPLKRSVRVIDASTGAQVASARIEWAYGVWNWGKGVRVSAETGRDGTAELVFENACSVARVTAAGFAPQEFDHLIPEVVRLSKAREVSGVVIDDVSGLPIEGASIEVFDPSVPSDAYTVENYIRDSLGGSGTDVAGRFCAEAGDAGAVRIECGAAGYEPTMIGVDDPGSSAVTLRLRPSGVIRGVVRDPSGQPARAVDVLCDGEGMTHRRQVNDSRRGPSSAVARAMKSMSALRRCTWTRRASICWDRSGSSTST